MTRFIDHILISVGFDGRELERIRHRGLLYGAHMAVLIVSLCLAALLLN